MSSGQYVIQVQDLSLTKHFLEHIIGFSIVSLNSSLIHLKHEYSNTSVLLLLTNLLSLKGIGGVIYLIQSLELFNSTFNLVTSSNYQCKKLDFEGKTMMIEGPFGITVICTSSIEQNNNNSSSISLLEKILQNQTTSAVDGSKLQLSIPSRSSSQPDISLNSPPIMTNFTLQIFDLKGFSNLSSNSRQPIPFETKSFSGVVLFIVRTKPLDPYYRHFFENNQRMYIIQVQGKFKKPIHSDEMFMGIESTCSMGMMSKSICRAMLKFLSNNNGGGTLRHSLGDSKNSSAFMCSTLINAVDRLCITPFNETPPPITYEFPESKEIKAKRRQKTILFDTSSTYSFTIKGKNIDFCEWSTCGFRMINPTNLSNFIGNNTLRLVAYTEKKNSIHSGGNNNNNSDSNENDSIQSRRRPGLTYFIEIEINSQFTSLATPVFSSPQESDSESDTDDITNDLRIDKSDLPEVVDSKILIPSLSTQERESIQLSPEELVRSDRVLSVHLTKSNPGFVEGLTRRPVSSPPRSSSTAELPPKPPINSNSESISVTNDDKNNTNNNNNKDITTNDKNDDNNDNNSIIPILPLTDSYLIAIPSGDESDDDNRKKNNNEKNDFDNLAAGRLENIYSPTSNPSMRMISVKLERIVMEWTIEDMKYCPAAIEINDYRRGRNRRVAYVVLKPNSPSRLRSYMQLAEIIPLLLVDDVESRSGRFTENELRRRQLAISLKKISLLSLTDRKIEAIWNGIFSSANDLDEYFLKKVSAPRNRMNGIRLAYDTEQVQSQSRTSSEDHLFDQSFRSASPITSFLSSSTTVRMEGSVAICTGRRSWSEEWAVLTGKYFAIPTPRTAKHLRIPSVISLGQICSVNVLSEAEKPFPGFEFFTIGTAARVYYFCVKNEYVLGQWIDALLQYQLPPSFNNINSGSINKDGIALDSKEVSKNDQLSESTTRNNGGMMGDNLPEEPEACIVNPGNFSSTNSRVLNHRRITFHGYSSTNLRSALILSKQILRRILKICQNTTDKNSVNPDITDWIEFSEKVSLLQSVSLHDLTKNDLIAFFLNVYHTLLLHAFIVLGVPNSNTDWRTLKNSASYEIAGDLITLRDIDEVILGNISNKIVVFTFLRVQISQADAFKQIDSKKPKQLDPTIMFPSSRLYFGEIWDYSIPMSHVSSKDITNSYNCDWRVALCITNGYCDMSNKIYIYDGSKLNEQLDLRCKEILQNRIRVDSSPPSMLSNTPSISLPKALSCLIPIPSSSSSSSSVIINGRSSPYETTSSPTFRSTNVNNNANNNTIISNDDPRLWLPILSKYIRSDIYKIMEQIFQSNYKIYVVFDIPDYSHFKFLKLKDDDIFADIEDNDELTTSTPPITTITITNSSIITDESVEILTDSRKDKVSRYSMSDTITKTSTINESTSLLSNIGTGEYDRSMSLDSARDNSSMNLLQQQNNSNLLSHHSSLQRDLFSDSQLSSQSEGGLSLLIGKPPIPHNNNNNNNSKSIMKRTSIEELRFALQSDIPPPATSPLSRSSSPPISSSTNSSTLNSQTNNKTKPKKKSFFGWNK